MLAGVSEVGRLPVRGGGHRGLDDAVGGASADTRVVRPLTRGDRPDQNWSGRRGGTGAGHPRSGRASWRARSLPPQKRWASTCPQASASTPCDRRSTAWWRPPRRPGDPAGPAVITGRFRYEAPAPSSPARSAAGAYQWGTSWIVGPASQPVRVRGLQSHYHSLASAEPGRRVAVNLTGSVHQQVGRGHAMVRPGQWQLTRTVDASLHVLPSVGSPLGSRARSPCTPGPATFRCGSRVSGRGGAQHRTRAGGFRSPLAAWRRSRPSLPGDRYILRELGRGELMGGGVVLDIEPVGGGRRPPSASAERVAQDGAGRTSTTSNG